MLLSDNNPRRQTPVITLVLIFINAAAFLATVFRSDFEAIVWQHGFVAQYFQAPDLITSMFLHANLEHVVFNMFFLWIFGDNVEDKLGRGLFLLFYFLGGIFADIIYWTTARHAQELMPSIGASGAVSAVLGGYMIFFPGAKIGILTMFGPYEVDALTYLGFWFAGQFFMLIMGGEGINYVAHLAGFIFGIFFATLFQSRHRNL